jgi:hypothetical protein
MPKCSLQLSLYQYLHGTLATSAQVVLLLQMQKNSKISFWRTNFCEGKWRFFWSTLWEYSIYEMENFKIN